MVLTNAMQYAVEVNPLAANPLKAVKWTRPRTLKTVDQRAVTNADQARRFLAAVAGTGPRGERIIAFLGCLYYATLRPEEAVDLSRGNLLNLPDQGWGEMLLTHSEPRSGTSWTDNGLARQRRELKHRAPGETRTAPVHPELVALFRDHLAAVRHRPRRPHLHRPARRHPHRPRLPRGVPPGRRRRVHRAGSRLAAGPPPLRAAACRRVHLA
jgi:hypothetical protein